MQTSIRNYHNNNYYNDYAAIASENRIPSATNTLLLINQNASPSLDAAGQHQHQLPTQENLTHHLQELYQQHQQGVSADSGFQQSPVCYSNPLDGSQHHASYRPEVAEQQQPQQQQVGYYHQQYHLLENQQPTASNENQPDNGQSGENRYLTYEQMGTLYYEQTHNGSCADNFDHQACTGIAIENSQQQHQQQFQHQELHNLSSDNFNVANYFNQHQAYDQLINGQQHHSLAPLETYAQTADEQSPVHHNISAGYFGRAQANSTIVLERTTEYQNNRNEQQFSNTSSGVVSQVGSYNGSHADEKDEDDQQFSRTPKTANNDNLNLQDDASSILSDQFEVDSSDEDDDDDGSSTIKTSSSGSNLSRDEKRAREANIPLTYNEIVNLSIDQFNEQLTKFQLSEQQLTLIKDIRRRGKNKVAAQSCRKRKMEQIFGLQHEVSSLVQKKVSLNCEFGQLIDEHKSLAQRYNEMCAYIQERIQLQQSK